MGLNPTEYWAFLLLLLHQWSVLNQIPQGDASLTACYESNEKYRTPSSATWVETGSISSDRVKNCWTLNKGIWKGKKKKVQHPAGLEPSTFRFVDQHSSHCVTTTALLSISLSIDLLFHSPAKLSSLCPRSDFQKCCPVASSAKIVTSRNSILDF